MSKERGQLGRLNEQKKKEQERVQIVVIDCFGEGLDGFKRVSCVKGINEGQDAFEEVEVCEVGPKLEFDSE